MQATIVIAEGALRGRSISLAGGEFTIGRDAKNALVIADDPVISRKHCQVRLVPGDGAIFEIVDFDTVNGTYVNDLRVSRATLAHGDRISIGSTVMVFVSHDGVTDSPQFVEDSAGRDSTIEWSPGEVRRLSDVEGSLTLPERHLEALLRFAGTIHSVPDERAVQYRMLEFLFETLPCDRGAIILSTAGGTVAGWSRQDGPGAPPPVSRTIYNRVFDQGVAVLSRDTESDEDLQDVRSINKDWTRSLIAAPLMANGGVAGVVWMEAQTTSFESDQVRFVSAACGVASRALENIRQRARLEHENRMLQKETGTHHVIVGESPAIRKVYEQIRKLSAADCPVLILGQTGTGKELAARAIHEASARAHRRFVAINCAVLSDTLLESDLFGHEKGAFTGAVARKEGKLEYADGGTLFLDEVGELTAQAQAKLLRVTQEHEFERVGGTRTIKTNVRVLAATNRDLAAESANGRFRWDLYYRLNVVSLPMPPLRERLSDIPLIAQYWLSQSNCARHIRGISQEARKCLAAYPWPGNVRELQNAIERAIILGAGEWILPEDLPDEVISSLGPEDPAAGRYQEGLRRAKRSLVLESLELANWDYREAARLLGVHVTYLYRLVRSLELTN